MKHTFFLSVVLLVLIGKIHSQDHSQVPKLTDSAYTYFGVVYKDAFRWIDTIRKPQSETLYTKQVKYGNSTLTEMPDRYKMIADLRTPGKLKTPARNLITT